MKLERIGLIGFGEVGKIFTAGLREKSGVVQASAWDLKFTDAALRATEMGIAQAGGIHTCASMRELCEHSDLIISAVTASNTLAVAREAASFMRAGQTFLDLNSASPGTKQQAAAAVQAAGADYVEAGVMTSVPPYGIRVPMLLGGAQAASLARVLHDWGMDAKAVSEQLGVASAIKMCRSVMIKGLEALVIESYTTARAYGVEDHVLPTLQETFPSIDWSEQGAYFFSRVVQHGKRRATGGGYSRRRRAMGTAPGARLDGKRPPAPRRSRLPRSCRRGRSPCRRSKRRSTAFPFCRARP